MIICPRICYVIMQTVAGHLSKCEGGWEAGLLLIKFFISKSSTAYWCKAYSTIHGNMEYCLASIFVFSCFSQDCEDHCGTLGEAQKKQSNRTIVAGCCWWLQVPTCAEEHPAEEPQDCQMANHGCHGHVDKDRIIWIICAGSPLSIQTFWPEPTECDIKYNTPPVQCLRNRLSWKRFLLKRLTSAMNMLRRELCMVMEKHMHMTHAWIYKFRLRTKPMHCPFLGLHSNWGWSRRTVPKEGLRSNWIQKQFLSYIASFPGDLPWCGRSSCTMCGEGGNWSCTKRVAA